MLILTTRNLHIFLAWASCPTWSATYVSLMSEFAYRQREVRSLASNMICRSPQPSANVVIRTSWAYSKLGKITGFQASFVFRLNDKITTSRPMSALLTIGRKCTTLAISHAAPWWVTLSIRRAETVALSILRLENRRNRQTDGRTDGRTVTLHMYVLR